MEPIKKVNIVNTVVERILESIASGEFKPNQHLPSEREFAKNLGISRGALREAFKRLESAGVLSIKQGSGVYVKDVDFSTALTQSVNSIDALDMSRLSELLEAREFVEVKVCGLAAEKATSEEIVKITSILNEMGNALHDVSRFAELDYEFHLAITEAAKNWVLKQMFSSIRDLLKEQQVKVLSSPEVINRSYGYHKRIAKAIENRNSVEAQSEMHLHLSSIPRSILTQLLKSKSTTN